MQKQAKALGDPTRHAIFQMVEHATHPIGVAEITERLGLNHNAIRQHLAKLVDAGLVVQATAPAVGPGRPRLTYTTDPVTAGPWTGPSPFQRLSLLLLTMLRTGEGPAVVGRKASPQFRVPVPSGDGGTDIANAMARQGFMPAIEVNDDSTDIVLHHCPFAEAASADRPTICGLHLGIAEGLTEGTGLRLDELIAEDPARANCVVRLAHPATTEPAGITDAPTETAVLTLRPTTA